MLVLQWPPTGSSVLCAVTGCLPITAAAATAAAAAALVGSDSPVQRLSGAWANECSAFPHWEVDASCGRQVHTPQLAQLACTPPHTAGSPSSTHPPIQSLGVAPTSARCVLRLAQVCHLDQILRSGRAPRVTGISGQGALTLSVFAPLCAYTINDPTHQRPHTRLAGLSGVGPGLRGARGAHVVCLGAATTARGLSAVNVGR